MGEGDTQGVEMPWGIGLPPGWGAPGETGLSLGGVRFPREVGHPAVGDTPGEGDSPGGMPLGTGVLLGRGHPRGYGAPVWTPCIPRRTVRDRQGSGPPATRQASSTPGALPWPGWQQSARCCAVRRVALHT